MNEEFEKKLKEFIETLLSTSEYREYAKYRDELRALPKLKAQVDEYRAKNFELQLDQNAPFEQIEAFEREYVSFRNEPLVDDFLRNELALCRLMQQINREITEALDFD